MKSWIIGLILVLAAGAAYYYFTVYQPAATGTVTSAPAPAPEPRQEPADLPDRSVTEPVPETVWKPEPEAEVEEVPLPTLTDSDPVVLESLDGLVGEPAVSRYVVSDNVISRVVATIDMLGSRQVPGVVQAVQGPGSSFAVTVNDAPASIIRNEAGDEIPQYIIDPTNYQRYTPYVEMLEAADAADLVENYRELYPLFQEAFRQMGYPEGDFNDRLIEIIDELLETPDVSGPIELIKPEAYFLFADPELEACSAGQKILIRMGSDNASRVKAKLREIRNAL
jgi:hypothetical protein